MVIAVQGVVDPAERTRMDDYEDDYERGDAGFTPPEPVDPSALPAALRSLELFDDPYLSMQATNLGVVDQFCMTLEDRLRRTNFDESPTRFPEAVSQSAQSQMWIFAAYEVLRAGRQRAKEAIKWAENGGLATKIADLRKDVGFRHSGRLIRADQLQRLIDQPTQIDKLRDDLRRAHMPYERMHLLRISLAKHGGSAIRRCNA